MGYGLSWTEAEGMEGKRTLSFVALLVNIHSAKDFVVSIENYGKAPRTRSNSQKERKESKRNLK